MGAKLVGEVWIATRKRSDGSPVNDAARVIIDKITSYEASGSSSQEVSQYDSLAMALGSQEHSRRVRGLGLGPTPSQVFGVRARGGSSDPTYAEMQNELTQLRRKVIENEEQTRLKDAKFERMQAFQISLHQSLQGYFPSQVLQNLELALLDVLPINLFRFKRGMNNSGICARCNEAHQESVLHCIRDCSFTKEIWSTLGFDINSANFHIDFKPWLEHHCPKLIAGNIGISTNMMAELVAIKSGLQCGSGLNTHNIILETDSSEAIRLIEKKDLSCHAYGAIIEDIQIML
ncbi:LOB domain-containing protein 18-like [Senna tora]|uniref:LOB domain-containing protein 18-like n=1 Tax=Senna tora TaxID=362788 RepID=A0A834WYV9_9FABA|nr:LOB domain-containing protein 18-like [Senna tora]